ncbi:hypothetical protein FRB98_004718 [Tulasnella sp. 332]|nr:hypothetical protein FRB98_004718 [Tulasnella sp. 332]
MEKNSLITTPDVEAGDCMRAYPVTPKQRMVDTAALAQHHNSTLPIHRLVTEVFIEIFLHYIYTNGSTIVQHYAKIRNIALVSTTWAALVFETPTLWSYIYWRQSPHDLLNSLARSKGCPLEIVYRRGRSIDESLSYDRRLASFVDKANQEIHQWQTENLTISEAAVRASELLRSYINMPSTWPLKHLSLNRILDTPPSQLVSPLRLVADRLRALSLWNAPINWESPGLIDLEILILHGGISVDSPSASQLAQVLRACPRLVRLEIYYEPTMREAAAIDTSLIELPALTIFDMEVSPAVAAYILAVVRIPSCEKFSLVAISPKSTFIPDALQHQIPLLVSRIASSGFIDISMSEHDLRYEASEAVSIRLVAPESRSDSLAWIMDHIHSLTLSVPTRLIISTRHFPLTTLMMHPLASSVTKLEVSNNRDLVYYLGQPVEVEGVRRFPLPNLRELFLKSAAELEPQDFVSMVESRFGDIGSYSESEWARQQSGDWPELPVKLDKLFLPEACKSPKTKAAVRKLKRFVATFWSSLDAGIPEPLDQYDYYESSDEDDYGGEDDYGDGDWSDWSGDYNDHVDDHDDGGGDYYGDEGWTFSW